MNSRPTISPMIHKKTRKRGDEGDKVKSQSYKRREIFTKKFSGSSGFFPVTSS
jgi:hypothetical protein